MNVDNDNGDDGSDDFDPVPPIPPAANLQQPPAPIMNEMNLALIHIGFTQLGVRTRLRDEGLTSFNDLKSLTDKDIRDVAETFGRRTANDGRFIFGIRRTRLLIGLVHWVQDFGRIGETPCMTEFINNPDGFRDALDIALDRARVRKSFLINATQSAKQLTLASSRMNVSGRSGSHRLPTTFPQSLVSVVFLFPMSFGWRLPRMLTKFIKASMRKPSHAPRSRGLHFKPMQGRFINSLKVSYSQNPRNNGLNPYLGSRAVVKT